MERHDFDQPYGNPETTSISSKEVSLSLAVVSEARREMYRASGAIGFITRSELELQFGCDTSPWGSLDLDEILDVVALHPRLPHGYAYIEPSSSGQMVNWLMSTLSVLGVLSFDELFAASQRYCSYRLPGIAHPPRSVVKEFLRLDSRFHIDESNAVSVKKPLNIKLGDVQQWMIDTIKNSDGWVLHRSELFDLARQAGINANSISVYCSKERYFKQLEGCYITVTGYSPSSEDIDSARLRAQVLMVETVVQDFSVSEGSRLVIVDLRAGTELCNQGYWYPRETLNALIGQTRFQIYVDGFAVGTSSYFGSTSSQWFSGISRASVSAGDLVQIRFDLVEKTASIFKINRNSSGD